MQTPTYYCFREKFLKSELEFAKVTLHPVKSSNCGQNMLLVSRLLLLMKQETGNALYINGDGCKRDPQPVRFCRNSP
jgi:hypothetical protein